MNKRTKILLVLLSAATMTAAGALGLTGCKKNSTSNDKPSLEATYNSYKVYAEEKGQTVLSYDEWLKVITAGAKDGEDGKNGKDGEPGATIDKIILNEDGELEISFTDPGMPVQKVPLPEEVTHEHDYDEADRITLIPAATPTSDGLGYYKCTKDGCEHIELVIIRDYYKFTCTADGLPVSGVKIMVNGATGVSGADGVAKVAGYGRRNDYLVSVESEYYTPLASTATSGKQFDYEIKLSASLKEYDPDIQDMECDRGYEIGGAGKYAALITVEDFYGPATCRTALKFMGGENSAKKFKVKATSDNGVPVNIGTVGVYGWDDVQLEADGSYVLSVGRGGSETILIEADTSSPLCQIGDLHVTLTVEELDPPTEGTQDLPFGVTLGQEIAIPASSTGDAYLSFTYDGETFEGVDKIKINLPAGVTADFNGFRTEQEPDYDWGGTKSVLYPRTVTVSDGDEVELATDLGEMDKFLLADKVFTIVVHGSGARNVTVSAVYPMYSETNPGKITTLGAVAYEDENIQAGEEYYFTYTNNTGAAQYLIIDDKQDDESHGSGGITVNSSYVYSGGGNPAPVIVKVEDGRACTFVVNALDGGVKFNVKEFMYEVNGCHPDTPNMFDEVVQDQEDENKYTAEVYPDYDSGTIYYSYYAEKTGKLSVSATKGTVNLLNKETGVSMSGSVQSIDVTQGDEILVTFRILGSGASTITFTYATDGEGPVTPPVTTTDPVDYLVVLDGLGNPADITIKIMNGDEEIATKTSSEITDDQGGSVYGAVFNLFIPASETYTIVVEVPGYGIKSADTLRYSSGDSRATVIFAELVDYNVTVVRGDGAADVSLDGVTAVLGGKEVALVNGACTINTVAQYGALTFTGVPEGYVMESKMVTAAGGSVSVTIVKADGIANGAADSMMFDMSTGYELVMGKNFVQNSAETGAYKFTATESGTYTFRVDSGDGYFYGVEVGGWFGDTLVSEGKQVALGYGIVLNSSADYKPFNEVTLTLHAGDEVALTYNGGVGGASTGYIVVSAVIDEAD